MLDRICSLFRRRAPTSDDAAERRSKPPTEAEVDDTLSKIMAKLNRQQRDLRGDGKDLEGLIHRIEATTREGRHAMKGVPP